MEQVALSYKEAKDKFYLLSTINVLVEDKLTQAVRTVSNSMFESLSSIEKDLSEEVENALEEIDVNYANVNEAGILVYDNVGSERYLQYTRVGLLEKNRSQREKRRSIFETYNSKTIYFNNCIIDEKASARIKTLPFEIKQALKGLLF